MKLVFKILGSANGFPAVNYNDKKLGKDRGTLTHIQNFHTVGHKPLSEIPASELRDYLEQYSARNKRVKNPQFHAVLSCNCKDQSFAELTQTAKEIMKTMGYADNPILIYGHNDTNNNHVHIVTSRVGPDGKKINHDFEKLRAMAALNEILGVDVKDSLKRDIEDASKWNFGTKAGFLMIMEQKGYKITQGNEGYVFSKYGRSIDSIQELPASKGINPVLRNKALERVKTVIGQQKERDKSLFNLQLDKRTGLYSCKLADVLQRQGYHLMFFQKDGKLPYGFSVLDHNKKIVFKGSELGIGIKSFLTPERNEKDFSIVKPLVVKNQALEKTEQIQQTLYAKFSTINTKMQEPASSQRMEGEEESSDKEKSFGDFMDKAIGSIIEEGLQANNRARSNRRSSDKRKRKGHSL
jgi:hypothetical protein